MQYVGVGLLWVVPSFVSRFTISLLVIPDVLCLFVLLCGVQSIGFDDL